MEAIDKFKLLGVWILTIIIKMLFINNDILSLHCDNWYDISKSFFWYSC